MEEWGKILFFLKKILRTGVERDTEGDTPYAAPATP